MSDESRWNLSWAERPAEEARIFNPAFCAELVCRTVAEYHRTRQTALNLATAFLVLPLTLHGPTRDALPRRVTKAFAGWIVEHDALLVELPDRTRHLRSVSREALVFAVHHQLLAFDAEGLLPGANPVRRNARFAVSTDEVNATRSAASLLGRWFAGQGSQSSILQGLGVAP